MLLLLARLGGNQKKKSFDMAFHYTMYEGKLQKRKIQRMAFK